MTQLPLRLYNVWSTPGQPSVPLRPATQKVGYCMVFRVDGMVRQRKIQQWRIQNGGQWNLCPPKKMKKESKKCKNKGKMEKKGDVAYFPNFGLGQGPKYLWLSDVGPAYSCTGRLIYCVKCIFIPWCSFCHEDGLCWPCSAPCCHRQRPANQQI